MLAIIEDLVNRFGIDILEAFVYGTGFGCVLTIGVRRIGEWILVKRSESTKNTS